jgi:carbonic anhydrase/acetyltransferase-like protein (isoleucine patch superfamily)
MAIHRLGDVSPQIAATAIVADDAKVIGAVTLGDGCVVRPGAVIRGDNAPIRIGAGTDIMEGVVVHASPHCPVDIGCGVTVQPRATVHGCEIGDACLIGMRAVVLDQVRIGANSVVVAGAVVRVGEHFPPRSRIAGVPAAATLTLSAEEPPPHAGPQASRKRASSPERRDVGVPTACSTTDADAHSDTCRRARVHAV